jgi:hypothetical protein
VALLLAAGPASAEWPTLPTVNLPVCNAPKAQYYRDAVTDGQGGVIVAWSDLRTDTADVYVQRVSAAGVPLWGAQGAPVCTEPWEQGEVTALADGQGGAFIVWSDRRTIWESDLYAQRVDATGAALWTAGGVPVCRMPGDQLAPVITRDAQGGIIVAWEDRRGTGEVYAQRLNGVGVRLWDTSGVAASLAVPPRFEPRIARDGLGGAIIAWVQQGVNGLDVLAQRISNIGERRWGLTGIVVGGGAGDQLNPAVCHDSQTGAFLAWEDRAGGVPVVRVQRYDYTGLWQFPLQAGLALTAAPASAVRPVVAPDAVLGVLVAWHDTRPGGEDVRVQRLAANGTPRWVAGGVVVGGANGLQQFPSLTPDARGGAMVAWEDARTGAWDVYVQRVDSLGVPRWAVNGLAVSTAASSQLETSVVSDDDSVGIVVWTDQRTGGTDLYAQRVPFAVTLAASAPAVPPALALCLHPHPARGPVTLTASLPTAAAVRIEVFDTLGRLVHADDLGLQPAGPLHAQWRRDAPLAPGLYSVRLSAGGASAAARVVLLP